MKSIQSIMSVLRQVLAVASIVVGALTSAVSGMHLPPAVSATLVAIGGGIIWIEHYVGDPSTGSTITTHVLTPTIHVSGNIAPAVQQTADAPAILSDSVIGDGASGNC